jgi:hypothetical protein
MAPSVAAWLARARERGQLKIERARLGRMAAGRDGIDVELLPVGGGAPQPLAVGRVVNCSGPLSDIAMVRAPSSARCSTAAMPGRIPSASASTLPATAPSSMVPDGRPTLCSLSGRSPGESSGKQRPFPTSGCNASGSPPICWASSARRPRFPRRRLPDIRHWAQPRFAHQCRR